jgi:hypothetical protein
VQHVAHFANRLALGTAETTEALIVKVAEPEPVSWPDSKQLRAGLFLSVPFLGGDRTKLEALARVRKGFKRNEIVPGWHVELSDEKVYSHRDDAGRCFSRCGSC